MLHIFISYAHKDGCSYRDTFISTLKAAGFKDEDFWFDQRDLEPGVEWRTAIDTALRESFIAVVLLTPEALKSHFVTYEWARADGDGLKVIPIAFEKIHSRNHPLLERKQYVDWNKAETPDRVIETIRNYQMLPPDINLLNHLIAEKLNPFRVLLLISTSFSKYLNTGILDDDLIIDLIRETRYEADTVIATLTELMVDKSDAFGSKQKIKCRELIKKIHEHFPPLVLIVNTNEYYSKLGAELENYRRELEPLIEFFAPGFDGWASTGDSFYLLQTHIRLKCNSNCDLISKVYIRQVLSPKLANVINQAIETIEKKQIDKGKENSDD